MTKAIERRAEASAERRSDTADYIADLTEELAKLARTKRLDVLAYLLDMARLEAKSAPLSTPGRKASGRRQETRRLQPTDGA